MRTRPAQTLQLQELACRCLGFGRQSVARLPLATVVTIEANSTLEIETIGARICHPPRSDVEFHERACPGARGARQSFALFVEALGTMAVAQQEAARQSFMPVPLSTLMVSETLPVDMYLRPNDDASPILYRAKRFELPPGEFERMTARGIFTIYIPADQVDDYQRHLRENVGTIINDQKLPLERRSLFLSETGRGMLGEVFKTGCADKAVEVAGDISGHMVALLSRNELLAGDLLDVLRHDYHTFTHSYNVASYVVLLAKGLGIREPEELQAISLGGLLHDLGKLRIPLPILTKKSRLSEHEWVVIKRHPIDGFSELCQRADLSHAQLMMVYQHHEKLDGSGYPVGVGSAEIHPYGRMCAVVDIFEALTSNRPYRSPMPAAKALAILEEEADTKLDGEMVRCWKSQVNRARTGRLN
jgi:HD-GYP domain-containing protein (c-di-GMP phosphodiesterase class II)